MKPIKNINNAFVVHMNIDWLAVNPLISEELVEAETGAQSPFCFDVGFECAKKMKNFVTKNLQL